MPPNAKINKACKAMKNLGYNEKLVRPILRRLLKLYENNWMLIEEDSYQVLVDAILDSEEQKAPRNESEHLNDWSEDEAEENEPPLKRSKLSRQKRWSSKSLHAATPNSSNQVEDQPHGKQKLTESISEKHQDKDVGLKAPRISKYHRKGTSSCSVMPLVVVEQAKEIKLVSDDENDKSYCLVPLAHVENNRGESDVRHDFSEKRMITYERDSTPVLPKDVYSIRNRSYLEGNNSESMDCEQSEAEKNGNNAHEFLKFDIASSSGDALLEQVEEQCLKSYKIPPAGFSMSKLMKEVCECFLAAGTTSTYTDDVRLPDAALSLGISKDTDSETNSAEGVDRQLSLCSTILINPIGNQNLFKVSPQIPRFVRPIELDLSHCRIYLNVDLKRYSGTGRNVMELNSHVPSSSRMMIVQNCCYHYISDITNGQEACEISLINELNEEQGPAFNYISKNMTYLRFLLARVSEECYSNRDCLSQKFPCACGGETGSEYAYTPQCLLEEKFLHNVISMKHLAREHNLFYCQDCPIERCNGSILSRKCKGHVMRNFIKECWDKCGCSIKCGNRVVQRGITAKLQVFRTPSLKGWGLRTLEDIPKGAFICEYVGEVISIKELFERNLQNSGNELTFPVLLDADWSCRDVLKDEEALCLDARVYGNVARFINHRCFDANLVEIPVEAETPDHNYYHLAFFTTRKVNALQELTWDYGIDFNHPVKAFQCLCGSKFCRDRKSLKRSLNLGN